MKQGRFLQNDIQAARADLRNGVSNLVKCMVRFLTPFEMTIPYITDTEILQIGNASKGAGKSAGSIAVPVLNIIVRIRTQTVSPADTFLSVISCSNRDKSLKNNRGIVVVRLEKR